MLYENNNLEGIKIEEAPPHTSEDDTKIAVETDETSENINIESSAYSYKVDVDGVHNGIEKPRKTTYDKRKTIAHGMMDTALISANANQLKFVIQFYKRDIFFHILVSLIILSLFIQVAVGVALIFRHRKKNKAKNGRVIKEDNDNKIMTSDEFIILGVFLVIVINIFVAAFSIGESNVDANKVLPVSKNTSSTI